MTKISKGTKVWQFINWTTYGMIAVRQCEVISIGKQQAAMRDLTTGEMIRERVYAREYFSLIPVADMADPIAHGVKVAAAYMLAKRFYNAARLRNPAYNRAGVLEDSAKLVKPEARMHRALCDEIAARYRAEYAAKAAQS